MAFRKKKGTEGDLALGGGATTTALSFELSEGRRKTDGEEKENDA